MPRYEYVIQRFKSYGAWKSVKQTQTETTFHPVRSTTRLAYRSGWVAAMVILLVIFGFAYQFFPAIRVAELSLEEFGAYIRQNRNNEIELTASACPEGIIGEINNSQIYWIELGYSGARWTATYDLPPSDWVEQCTPPIFVQSQRLYLLFGATIALTLLYIGFNYFVMNQRWKHVRPITIREHGETIIITEDGRELNSANYEQLDEHFNLVSDNINFQKVIRAALGFAFISSVLSIISAYLI